MIHFACSSEFSNQSSNVTGMEAGYEKYLPRILNIWFLLVIWLFSTACFSWATEDSMLKPYDGPKCVIAVGEFGVQLHGAPEDLGDGLREMLITALFESNRFIVVDRLDTGGLTAEQLLSDSFMADADTVLNKGKMRPAELIIYGALVKAEASGGGMRVKIPWVPISVGGKHHLAKIVMDIRVVDTASGEVVASHAIEGTARSGTAAAGAVVSGYDIPVSLEIVKNTPIGLAIRDCIQRSAIKLCETIPASFFRVKE